MGKQVHFTRRDLGERGWTELMVRTLLGEADAWRPRFSGKAGAPMRLFLVERVRAAEARPGFGKRKPRPKRTEVRETVTTAWHNALVREIRAEVSAPAGKRRSTKASATSL